MYTYYSLQEGLKFLVDVVQARDVLRHKQSGPGLSEGPLIDMGLFSTQSCSHDLE